MDAIKKKMMSLASETAQAEARAKSFEEEAIAATTLADKTEEQGSVNSKYLVSCLHGYNVLIACIICVFSYFFLLFTKTEQSFFKQVRNLQKKLQALEGRYDTCTEDLFNVTNKLEEKEKIFASAEGDVANLARR